MAETTKETVDLIFGVNAGTIWEALSRKGPSAAGDLAKETGLNREQVYGALGWLGREDKILVERRERTMVFSLRK
jgi:predicted ArsR family transcriptional regulator